MTTQYPRNTPSYRLHEAARYLRIRKATLRIWLGGQGSLKPLIPVADPEKLLISFANLIEAHLLDAHRRKSLGQYMERIDWTKDGAPAKLFPFTRKRRPNEPKSIVLDPTLAFGRPVLAGTGIATVVVAERFKAGESIQVLAKDYGRDYHEIEEAIRWELST